MQGPLAPSMRACITIQTRIQDSHVDFNHLKCSDHLQCTDAQITHNSPWWRPDLLPSLMTINCSPGASSNNRYSVMRENSCHWCHFTKRAKWHTTQTVIFWETPASWYQDIHHTTDVTRATQLWTTGRSFVSWGWPLQSHWRLQSPIIYETTFFKVGIAWRYKQIHQSMAMYSRS